MYVPCSASSECGGFSPGCACVLSRPRCCHPLEVRPRPRSATMYEPLSQRTPTSERGGSMFLGSGECAYGVSQHGRILSLKHCCAIVARGASDCCWCSLCCTGMTSTGVSMRWCDLLSSPGAGERRVPAQILAQFSTQNQRSSKESQVRRVRRCVRV